MGEDGDEDRKREKLIRASLAIIKRSTADRDACRVDIDDALNVINVEIATRRALDLPKSKKTRELARQVRASLRKLQIATREEDLDPFLALALDRIGIDELIQYCDGIQATPARTKRSRYPRHMVAAIEARWLLRKYCTDRRRQLATTRGGPYPKLAAVLAGDPNLDLYEVCRLLQKESRNRPLSRTDLASN